DVKMEEGSLRCDANVSVRPVGETKLGTKVEMKNINSIRGVARSIEYEAQRQAEALEDGEKIVQETRTWDESKGTTATMRVKEEADDYRYFPEPDLVPFTISDEYIESVRQALPELPDARKARLMQEHGLSDYDAGIITLSRSMAEYFDELVAAGADAKEGANWLMGDFSMLLNEAGKTPATAPVRPQGLAGMLAKIADGTISGKIAKTVFRDMWEQGKSADEIIEAKGLKQISDTGELTQLIHDVVAANPQSVEDYRAGKKKAIGFLVGQIMKKTKGRANPQVVNQLLVKELQE
ncbi:MAG: Asp-tRNA(Asn)/Glu-tRNA(Gln) amidotransferase subunit GatB, partial [Negativicoccus succinicivorans]|nr:Asp-tRNA(Asn)/Glu-tRNA(Gln) amidotransferase subunit GatB [Negativicoccus succinicivorans]